MEQQDRRDDGLGHALSGGPAHIVWMKKKVKTGWPRGGWPRGSAPRVPAWCFSAATSRCGGRPREGFPPGSARRVPAWCFSAATSRCGGCGDTRALRCLSASSVPGVCEILESNKVLMATEGRSWPLGEKNIFRPGEYTFDIVVGADGTKSVDYRLKLNWTGDWQTAELCPVT
jgi:hypothetical protein